jgi:hypothetical protein
MLQSRFLRHPLRFVCQYNGRHRKLSYRERAGLRLENLTSHLFGEAVHNSMV